MLDYLSFSKKYISECEEKYGYEEVEKILDSAHSLRHQGVDRYKRPPKLNAADELKRRNDKDNYLQKQFNSVLDKTIPKNNKSSQESEARFPVAPEENILKFVEKYSPKLKTWQREVIRIVRMTSQYYYPQRQTQVMNEGFACWTHMYIMNRLYDKGYLTEGSMLEFMSVHSNVVYQPDWEKAGAYFNPYALGLSIYRDIERICKNPSDEDKEWFPEFANNQDYISVIKNTVANYRDESFIKQFVSPKLMRDFKMFKIGDEDKDYYVVKNIHNDQGYKEIRRTLSKQYELSRIDPNIQIVNSNLDSNRNLELIHHTVDNQTLINEDAMRVLSHLKNLWGYDILFTSVNDNGETLETLTT